MTSVLSSVTPTTEAVLMAVGDIGLVGRVRRLMRERGGEYPFDAARQVLKDADVVFGNLEIPLLEREDVGFHNPVIPRTLIATVDAAPLLKRAGFTILSVANNHILDHGPEGLTSSLRSLRAAGLASVGAGDTLEAARHEIILESQGLRLGFLAYTSSASTWAGAGRAGAAPLKEDLVLEDVRRLRTRVDALIVSAHFGLMYTDYPRLEDQALLRRVIDAGADVILGHHPHVCQGIEEYGRGLIAYSLGEFVFDPRAGNVVARDHLLRRRETVILRLRFRRDGLAGWSLIPVKIDDDLAPMVATGEEADAIQRRLEEISMPLSGDSLTRIDLAAHHGSTLVGHETRVLWHHVRRLHLGYVLGKLRNIRARHVRMLVAGLRHRLARKGR